MPVVEGLAKRYHVYAIVMRFDGKTDCLNDDGTTHWAKQWGKDIYDFSQEMGIERFHYIGKCHGTIPGWWLFKEHPEVLIDFSAFFLGPHTLPSNSNKWTELLTSGNMKEMMAVAMKNVESGLKKKMEEMKCIGPNAGGEATMKYGGYPEMIWDNDIKTMEEDLRNATVPIGYLFGSDDPLFRDHYDSNMRLPFITKNCHFTILNGEKHLMELDCPERIVDEAFFFIDQAHKKYDEN